MYRRCLTDWTNNRGFCLVGYRLGLELEYCVNWNPCAKNHHVGIEINLSDQPTYTAHTLQRFYAHSSGYLIV